MTDNLNKLNNLNNLIYKTLNDWVEIIHDVNVEKGWFEDERTFGDSMALVHSEVSEAYEEYRDHGLDPDKLSYYALDSRGLAKPEGIAIELADAIIRICDAAKRYGIDLDAAMEQKVAYNKTRPYRHGGKVV